MRANPGNLLPRLVHRAMPLARHARPFVHRARMEYAIVGRILDMLEVIDAELQSKTLVDAWVVSLRKHYDAFMALRKDFHNERAEQPVGRIKATRQTLSDAWKTFVNYINGLAMIHPSAELNALKDVLNTIIQAKKAALKTRKRTKKTAAEAATEAVDIES